MIASIQPEKTRSLITEISLLTILFFTLVSRLHGIDRESLWMDELFSIWASYLPSLQELLAALKEDSHPPGYSLFLYYYRPLFDSSELWIRLHSLVAGVATVFVIYKFCERHFSAQVGLIAAILIATNYQSIYYSQEARAYSLLTLTCMTSLYCFMALLFEKNASIKTAICFVISSTFTSYLHYAGVVFIACEFVIFSLLFTLPHKNTNPVLIAGCFLLIGLLFSPWISTMLIHTTTFQEYWGSRGKPDLSSVHQLLYWLLGPSSQAASLILAGTVATTAFSVLGLIKKNRGLNEHHVVLIVFCMACSPILAFYIKSQLGHTVFQDRHFLFTIPLFCVLAAYAVKKMVSLIIAARYQLVITLLLAISIAFFQTRTNIHHGIYTNYKKDAIREAVEVVKQDISLTQNSTPIAFMSHRGMYYYMRKAGFTSPYDISTESQYTLELKPELMKKGSFYYVSIATAESYPFIRASKHDFAVECRREVFTASGIISIVKMVRREKEQGQEPDQKPRLCAPSLKFKFEP